jgi:hypothetical protein
LTRIAEPTESLGVVARLIGAPLFLFLLLRARQEAKQAHRFDVRATCAPPGSGVSFAPGWPRIAPRAERAGKSTLLRAVMGLVPYRGRVLLDDTDVRHIEPRARAKIMAYVPQRSLLEAPLSVETVVSQGRFAHTGGLAAQSARDREATRHAMERTDVLALAHRRFDRLSRWAASPCRAARSRPRRRRTARRADRARHAPRARCTALKLADDGYGRRRIHGSTTRAATPSRGLALRRARRGRTERQVVSSSTPQRVAFADRERRRGLLALEGARLMRATAINAIALAAALAISVALAGGTPSSESARDRSTHDRARTIVDDTGFTLRVGAHRRIASASTVADRLLLELCDPARIIAFSTASTLGADGHRYAARGHIDRLDDVERIVALQQWPTCAVKLCGELTVFDLVARMKRHCLTTCDASALCGAAE